LANRTVQSGLVHHSDRGVQYAAADYVALLQEHKIQISMSRTGNCLPLDGPFYTRFVFTLTDKLPNTRDLLSVLRSIRLR